MESGVSQSDGTQGPARAVVSGESTSLLGRMLAVFACGASSVVWLWFSALKPNYMLNLAVPMLVLLVGGVGLFSLEMSRVTAAVMAHRRYVHSFRSKYYAFAVLFTAAAMISIIFHAPLYARFVLSRPALDAFVADVQEHPDAQRPATMQVGSYVLETTPRSRGGGALMFYLAGDSETGFTYSTTPIAGYPGWNPGDGHRLGGGWYWFSDD
jgi:hypothetical protein